MKKMTIMIVITVIVLLPIMWYLVSPLFIDKVVNEEVPIQKSIPLIEKESNNLNLTYKGVFIGADSSHKTEGKALIISQEDKMYLRLEDFTSTNGPDLKVYLSEDINAKSYINLGELKGNIGNQNYEVPENTDLSKYKYALIWCEQFSVLFGHAELQAQ